MDGGLEMMARTMQQAVNEHRRGRIRVVDVLVEKRSHRLMPLFTVFLPVWIERRFLEAHYIYAGYSPLFEPVIEAEETPEYTAEFTENEVGDISVKMVKK